MNTKTTGNFIFAEYLGCILLCGICGAIGGLIISPIFHLLMLISSSIINEEYFFNGWLLRTIQNIFESLTQGAKTGFFSGIFVGTFIGIIDESRSNFKDIYIYPMAASIGPISLSQYTHLISLLDLHIKFTDFNFWSVYVGLLMGFSGFIFPFLFQKSKDAIPFLLQILLFPLSCLFFGGFGVIFGAVIYCISYIPATFIVEGLIFEIIPGRFLERNWPYIASLPVGLFIFSITISILEDGFSKIPIRTIINHYDNNSSKNGSTTLYDSRGKPIIISRIDDTSVSYLHNKFYSFFTKNIIGVLILGTISSLLATLIVYFANR